MKEYEGLTPSEPQKYEDLLITAYPQPSADLKDAVMEKIAAERAKRRRKSQLMVRWGTLAACLVILTGASLKVLPVLARMNRAKKSDSVTFAANDSEIHMNYADLLLDAQMNSATEDSDSVDELSDDILFGTDEPCDGNTGSVETDADFESPEANAPNDALGDGGGLLDRKYSDDVYNLAYLQGLYENEDGLVSNEELEAWVNEEYLTQSPAEMNALPDLYQAINALGIEKGDLVTLNNSRKEAGKNMVLSSETIDALYLEEDEMQQALMSPVSLYYNGEVYSFTEVNSMTAAEAEEKGIPADVIEDYLNNVLEYSVENNLIRERDAETFRNESVFLNSIVD